jgi:hypothetical protein
MLSLDKEKSVCVRTIRTTHKPLNDDGKISDFHRFPLFPPLHGKFENDWNALEQCRQPVLGTVFYEGPGNDCCLFQKPMDDLHGRML